MVGWIKLHRKIINSPMYKSLNSKHRDVLIQVMLLANHEANEWDWQGEIFKCQPGQFISSLQSIADQCAKDVKVQSVRTALLKLVKWGFLTDKSTKTGRLITITKWHTYQTDEEKANKDSNRQLTKSQQSSNKELTTNKNDKECSKNEKNKTDDLSPPTSSTSNSHLKHMSNKDVSVCDISFSEFWDIYPERNGKKLNKAATKKKFFNLKSDELADIIVAVHNYKESEMISGGIGIKDPDRFISNRDNKEYWKEWLTPEKTNPQTKHETPNESRPYHKPVDYSVLKGRE